MSTPCKQAVSGYAVTVGEALESAAQAHVRGLRPGAAGKIAGFGPGITAEMSVGSRAGERRGPAARPGPPTSGRRVADAPPESASTGSRAVLREGLGDFSPVARPWTPGPYAGSGTADTSAGPRCSAADDRSPAAPRRGHDERHSPGPREGGGGIRRTRRQEGRRVRSGVPVSPVPPARRGGEQMTFQPAHPSATVIFAR